MLGRIGICIVLMVLALFIFSCTKLDDPPIETKGETLTIEKLAPLNSIPSEYTQRLPAGFIPSIMM